MKTCDYYSDDHRNYWCILKKGEVSSETYRDFCKCDEMKKCPIYQNFKENLRRWYYGK